MNKRWVLALVMIVALVGGLVASSCAAPAPTPAPAPAPTPAPAPAPAPTPAPAVPAEVIKWRIQSFAPAADRSFQQTKRYAEMITTMSNGRLVVEAFPAGAILPAHKEFEGLLRGSVEAVHTPDGWLQGLFPSSYLFSQYVGGLTGVQNMLWELAGGGHELAEEMVKDQPVVFVSPLTVHPAEVWLHSKKRLDTLADLKGLKVRFGAPALVDIFGKMGVAGVSLPGGEIYEAAQRGVIDGFEYITPSVDWGMGFQEVTDYLYLSPSRAPCDRQSVWVTKDVWEALSPDLQEIVVQSARALVPLFFGETIVLDAEALKKFKEYGNEVLSVPKEIDEELYKVATEYYDDQAAKDPFFKKVLESQRAFKALCEEQNIR